MFIFIKRYDSHHWHHCQWYFIKNTKDFRTVIKFANFFWGFLAVSQKIGHKVKCRFFFQVYIDNWHQCRRFQASGSKNSIFCPKNETQPFFEKQAQTLKSNISASSGRILLKFGMQVEETCIFLPFKFYCVGLNGVASAQFFPIFFQKNAFF